MQWIYVLCILAAGAIAEDSFERVRRAPGKRCPRIQNFPGKVKYKRRGTRAQFRCYKTFSRYGPRFVSCRSDNTWSGEPPLCIKAGCVPIDIQHHIKLDMTESYGGALLSFKCEDEYQLIGSTEISCDSKMWSATPPVCKAPIQLTECDFEIDLCGWTQDDSDELDWMRTQGQTSTGGTGPKADHTFQSLSGHYMFVESSNPARNGDQARLLSPVYPADMGDMCFEFWYHILGPDDPGHVGTLEVYVRGDSEFIDDLQPLFVKGGNQGDVWKRGDIYIDKRDEPYQIVIVTTRKLSYISDIAIDDVRLYNCSGITTSTTTPSTTTSTTTTPASTAASTISSTVTSATLSTSQPTGLPRAATTPTSAKVSSSTGTSSTGTTSLFTTTPIISPSSTVSASTPSKSSSKETTPVPVPSTSGNLTSAVSATTTNKVTSTISVPLETTTVGKPSSTTTTQLPVTSSTVTTSTSTPVPSQSTSTPKPSTSSKPTTSTVQTVKSTTSGELSSTTTTERLTSTSTIKTSTTSSGVKTGTSSTTRLPTTTASKVSSTTARTTPASTETSTKETTSLSTTGTTSQSTFVSPSTLLKLKTTSSTTVKSSSETPTMTDTITTANTQKSRSTEAIMTKTVSMKISTTSVKVNKTVSTESKVTTVESNDTEPVVVAQPRSQHPADETLRPLMIGLGVGIVAGLIIIGVVAWVCVRRRKFYTSRYEDELKPITKSSSNENFNNIQYEYHDDEEYQ